jgi:hypothetical protein
MVNERLEDCFVIGISSFVRYPPFVISRSAARRASMENPYQSPVHDFKDHSGGPFVPPPQGGFGWVSQVRVIAVLNCVQGGLELLMGLLYVGMAIMMTVVMQTAPQDGPNPPPAGMEWLFLGVYGGLSVPLFIVAVLRIYAGIQNFQFRGRTLGIVTMCVGVASALMGCYCLPTSVALMVYGLIVYLNESVAAAFEMGRQGADGSTILASFASQHYRPPMGQ